MLKIISRISQAKPSQKDLLKCEMNFFYDNTSHPSAYIPKRIDNGLVDIPKMLNLLQK